MHEQHKDSGRSATCNAGSSSAPRDGTAEAPWVGELRTDGDGETLIAGDHSQIARSLGIRPRTMGEIARRCNGYPKLVEALRSLLRENPAFRNRPIGAPGSTARAAQDAAIEAEDSIRSLLREFGEKL